MDWSSIKIRCSSIGALMTPPKDKEEKLRGELSVTAKKYLIKTFIKAKYDREKDIITPAMTKGITQEGEGIKMLSEFYGYPLEKNNTRFENAYLNGHPDVLNSFMYEWLHIHDTKLSEDIFTFFPNILEGLDDHHNGQLQGYMALTGAKTAEIDIILADASETAINDEKRKLLYRMNVVSEEDKEYQEAAAGVEINMIYPDIPLSEKILVFPVERDDEYIERIYKKVDKAREFLEWFENKHKNFNKIRSIGIYQ
jgi:hypothetical protein